MIDPQYTYLNEDNMNLPAGSKGPRQISMNQPYEYETPGVPLRIGPRLPLNWDCLGCGRDVRKSSNRPTLNLHMWREHEGKVTWAFHPHGAPRAGVSHLNCDCGDFDNQYVFKFSLIRNTSIEHIWGKFHTARVYLDAMEQVQEFLKIEPVYHRRRVAISDLPTHTQA